MKLSDLNPHIRYAATHYNFLRKPFDSICYDCRFFYVKEGNGTVTADGETYSFSENCAIFFPPGTRYHFDPDKACRSLVMQVFNFDLINDYSYLENSLGTVSEASFEKEKLIAYEMPEELNRILFKKTASLQELLDSCAREFLLQNDFFRETSSALLKLALLAFLQAGTAEAESDKIKPVLEYIHTHYQDPDLNNASIAQYFSYHPYYLSKLVKQYTGRTLHQYLTDCRLRAAKENLITTNDSIHTISWKTGFRSAAYFVKTFKEHTGTTPAAYKKEHIPFLF